MKKKSERLKVVLDLAERKEHAAMDVLQQRRRYLDQQREQLESLKSYHQQYLDGIRQNMSGASSVQKLQIYQGFLSQISKAIEQQTGTVQIAQREFDVALNAWKLLHQKRKGMADLIATYRQQELISAEKIIQKRLEDDFVARRFSR